MDGPQDRASDNLTCCHTWDSAGRPWLLSQPVTLYWHRPNQEGGGGHSGNQTRDLLTRSHAVYRRANAPPETCWKLIADLKRITGDLYQDVWYHKSVSGENFIHTVIRSGEEKFRVSAIYIIAEHLLFLFSMEYLTVSAYKIRYAKWFKKKKSQKNLRSSVLCHNLTIYKQFSTHKFINRLSINYTKKNT